MAPGDGPALLWHLGGSGQAAPALTRFARHVLRTYYFDRPRDANFWWRYGDLLADIEPAKQPSGTLQRALHAYEQALRLGHPAIEIHRRIGRLPGLPRAQQLAAQRQVVALGSTHAERRAEDLWRCALLCAEGAPDECEEAAALLREAMRPGLRGSLYVKLGRTALDLGALDVAEAAYACAQEEDGDGDAYGLPEVARRKERRALLSRSQSEPANAAVAHRLGQLEAPSSDAAIALFARAVALAPRHAGYTVSLMQNRRDLDRPRGEDQLHPDLAAALRRFPHVPELYVVASSTLHRRSRAVAYLDQALVLAPDNAAYRRQRQALVGRANIFARAAYWLVEPPVRA